MYHVSCVICHVSPVTCHVSHIQILLNLFTQKKKKLKKLKKYTLEEIGQNGGASRWRVCYQRGLPRLTYCNTTALDRIIKIMSLTL